LLPSSRNILFVKRIESLLHTASNKFEFEFLNLENLFHKGKFSFLVVKTVECKRNIHKHFKLFYGKNSAKKSNPGYFVCLFRLDPPVTVALYFLDESAIPYPLRSCPFPSFSVVSLAFYH